MKRFLFIAATATAMMAGCTKNVTTGLPSERADNEITFQTILMPSTKAYTSTQHEFDKTQTFNTFAYMLAAADWDTDVASATPAASLWINDKTVSYVSADNLWKTATTYYWPKTGYLTFFSYYPGAADVKCAPKTGITLTDYDVVANPMDFMVADIAKNKNANENIYQWNGVPTLFRHKLSKVSVSVTEEKDYANGHGTGTYQDGDKVFTLTGITITNINTTGDYAQTGGSSEWTGQGDKETYTYFSGSQEITTTTALIGGKKYVIPQGLPDDALITVGYDITTYVDDGAGGVAAVVEHVTITRKVADLTATWEAGKDITYKLNFDMSDPSITDPSDPNYGKDSVIYWDPAVEDWDASTHSVNI